MKKIIFLLLLMLITIPVHAASYNSFYYDNERVSDMWISKVEGDNSRSANPYILKRISDNAYVYCLEAFVLMQNGINYTLDSDYTKYGLTKEDIDKINLIIYYGYGYGNHTSKKWYGITQYLIWKITDKNANIYFTDKQWGDKKELYTSEINEINSLINEHYIEPNFIKDYTISTNSTLKINSNVNIGSYNITSDAKYEIVDNNIVFNNLEKGEYTVKIVHKDDRYNTDYLLYYNNDSQNIIIPGHSYIYSKEYEFKIKVVNGEVNISKKDENNNIVEGATYGIYNDDNLIKEITTSSNTNNIELPFGNYKVKELSAPNGYELDTKEYNFVIDNNNLSIKLDLYDNKLLGNITLIKKSTYNGMKLSGAKYGIYKDNELITTLTTDSNGLSKTKLEFGNYMLKEIEAPPGYKLDDKEYNFVVDNNNLDIKFNLKDDRVVIEVPDTGLKSNNISYSFILIGSIGLIYVKTKHNMC